jgi:hypothetical protein
MQISLRETVGRTSLWPVFLVAVSLRLALVAVFELSYGSFLFLDDHGYDSIGSKLADAWHHGTFLDPSSFSLTGGYVNGYFIWVGILYYVFGDHWLVVKIFCALISGLAVVPANSIGGHLGGQRFARQAVWLVAAYPSAVFWGATGLKDAQLLTLFLAVVALGLKPLAPRRLALQLALIGIAFVLRPWLGAVCLLTLVPSIAQAIRARGELFRTLRRRVGAALAAGAALYLAIPHVARGLEFLRQAASSEAAVALPSGSAFTSLRVNPSSVVTAAIGPFPWAFGEGTDTILRATYPGTTIWIILLPAAALGAWMLLRRGSGSIRSAIVAGVAYFAMYVAYWGDEGFFRQRLLMEMFFLIVGAFAFHVRADSAALLTAIWVVCLAPAILVQAGIVPLWGVVIIVGVPLTTFALMRLSRARAVHAR